VRKKQKYRLPRWCWKEGKAKLSGGEERKGEESRLQRLPEEEGRRIDFGDGVDDADGLGPFLLLAGLRHGPQRLASFAAGRHSWRNSDNTTKLSRHQQQGLTSAPAPLTYLVTYYNAGRREERGERRTFDHVCCAPPPSQVELLFVAKVFYMQKGALG